MGTDVIRTATDTLFVKAAEIIDLASQQKIFDAAVNGRTHITLLILVTIIGLALAYAVLRARQDHWGSIMLDEFRKLNLGKNSPISDGSEKELEMMEKFNKNLDHFMIKYAYNPKELLSVISIDLDSVKANGYKSTVAEKYKNRCEQIIFEITRKQAMAEEAADVVAPNPDLEQLLKMIRSVFALHFARPIDNAEFEKQIEKARNDIKDIMKSAQSSEISPGDNEVIEHGFEMLKELRRREDEFKKAQSEGETPSKETPVADLKEDAIARAETVALAVEANGAVEESAEPAADVSGNGSEPATAHQPGEKSQEEIDRLIADTRPVVGLFAKAWGDLTDKQRSAAYDLGIGVKSWGSFEEVDEFNAICKTAFYELLPEQKLAIEKLGLTEKQWNSFVVLAGYIATRKSDINPEVLAMIKRREVAGVAEDAKYSPFEAEIYDLLHTSGKTQEEVETALYEIFQELKADNSERADGLKRIIQDASGDFRNLELLLLSNEYGVEIEFGSGSENRLIVAGIMHGQVLGKIENAKPDEIDALIAKCKKADKLIAHFSDAKSHNLCLLIAEAIAKLEDRKATSEPAVASEIGPEGVAAIQEVMREFVSPDANSGSNAAPAAKSKVAHESDFVSEIAWKLFDMKETGDAMTTAEKLDMLEQMSNAVKDIHTAKADDLRTSIESEKAMLIATDEPAQPIEAPAIKTEDSDEEQICPACGGHAFTRDDVCLNCNTHFQYDEEPKEPIEAAPKPEPNIVVAEPASEPEPVAEVDPEVITEEVAPELTPAPATVEEPAPAPAPQKPRTKDDELRKECADTITHLNRLWETLNNSEIANAKALGLNKKTMCGSAVTGSKKFDNLSKTPFEGLSSAQQKAVEGLGITAEMWDARVKWINNTDHSLVAEEANS